MASECRRYFPPRLFNSLPLAAGAALLLTAGCGRDTVKVYKVDSSDLVATSPPPVAAAAPAVMPATMPEGLPTPDNSSLPKLKYTLPAGWTEKTPTQMRVASFEITENGGTADVSVIPLGGMAGGDAANVNRWRGQVGEPPLDEAGVVTSAEPAQVGDKSASMYDIAGTIPGGSQKTRIIGAILHADDSTWYFKIMGDAELVERNKPAFIAFLKSVQFQTLAAPAAMDLSQLPPSHPTIPEFTPQSTTPAGGPTWTVPSDWKEGELLQFLAARFIIQGGGESAAVNVSHLDGDGGGVLPNLNRWRAQLGQPPITEDEAARLPAVDASGVKGVLADFTGRDARSGKAARLIGVVLPLDGQTWFYKLMGDPDLVGRQKDPLIHFIQSARYPASN